MSFTIQIRRGTDSGTLTFENAGTSVNTPCWWDPEVKVDPGTYTGYATRMASKTDGRDGLNREAIWLGQHVPVNGNSRTSNEIFIHKGKNAGWSDGCIVCDSDEVLRIWDAVEPKEQGVITVNVMDE